MARQTVKPDQWIVADGGATPVNTTMGQIHIHDARPPGPLNFGYNLLNGIAACANELLIIIEDDDFYRADHIERIVEKAEAGYRLIGSEDIQRYYNVAHRSWKMMNNIGASLCQTALRRDLFPLFRKTIQECMGRGSYGIDTTLWRAARNDWAFTHQMTVCGIKGLPGRIGLGIGHRPDARWSPDPHLTQLRKWIGADADLYAEFMVPKAA